MRIIKTKVTAKQIIKRIISNLVYAYKEEKNPVNSKFFTELLENTEWNWDNKVIRVTVGDNNDPNGDEGYQWLIDNLGGRWIQTSYNANFRGKFAGIGDTYDEANDVFVAPKLEGE